MAIIKQTNKKTGVTYVYDSHSYWDKEKKQHRSDRKLIGKIDPETGEIVPTRKKKEVVGTDKESSARIKTLEANIAKKDEELQSLRDKVSNLQRELKDKDRILDKIRLIVTD
ncbi:MAG: hypothetical protein K6G83_04855 [Lachnospiraceae bacterium]|nr:hypothetical protein [Lachnospiraceae bacterium]